MHSDEMSMHVEQFLLAASALQWKKNKDYHPDRVAFLEILRTAHECGITVEQDLWAKIRKQYIALHSYVINGKTESETPNSRMTDITVYLGMLNFWIERKQSITRDAAQFILEHTECELPKYCGLAAQSDTLTDDPDIVCERCQFLHWLGDLIKRHAAQV